jgi:hypothetical protein
MHMTTQTDVEAETNAGAADPERERFRALGIEDVYDDEQIRAEMQSFLDIAPEDDLESMLALQLIITHRATFECYRYGIGGGVTPDGFAYLNLANKLSRTFVLMLGALDRHRQKAPEIKRHRSMRAVEKAERAKLAAKDAKQLSAAASRAPQAKSAKQPSAAPSPVPEVKSAKQPSASSPVSEVNSAKQPSAAPSAVPEAKSAKQPSAAPSPAPAPPSGNADSAKQPPKMTLARAYELMGPGEPDPTTRGRRMIYTVPPEHRNEILAVFEEERKRVARSNGGVADVHGPILRCP